MLDRIHLFVPFKLEHITLLGVDGRADPVHLVDIESLGIPLQAQITVDEEGNKHADYLRHAWESLGTGFTPMAMKVFHESMGKRLMPGVELKASPAKLMQGHNVFGSTCIEKGALTMLKWLAGTYPKLFEMLAVDCCEVYDIDCTYSSRLPDERTARQAIQAIRGVSNGQMKGRGDDYETTAYFGAKDSRLRRLKIYLKHPEFMKQLDDAKKAGRGDLSAARTVKVLSNPDLQAWSENLLRLEVTVAKRWFNRRGISNLLNDLIRHQQVLSEQGICFIQWCWEQVTKDLFAAFEGIQMRVINDEKVLAALLEKHTKQGKGRYTKEKMVGGIAVPPIFVPGKTSDAYARSLFRTYRSLKDYGWEETLDSMNRASFYNHIRDICECGISKAALQKLKVSDQQNNIVPILRFVQVDFNAQRPGWYVEPTVEAA